ncbi:hypothetical protein A2230_01585 [candidate division WOR-1 bacterium RIFOXYA2_FULL_36_21]|uniref:Uncharacterized protein n=1 Tax=candidate division WOR-1 bacterium RIFOXYB2_FULL_36_35 TaxID=1802578 RepID=A0A1F4S990_UNCSA|nr:MAG: hypothetical protein A2230_01585 [candidate division WOR-1 bacterium RIFOXYA2_FULL_36_21]OGC16303.1 MAG: hypothetical protein A2290_04310 [candidate division WOR-1 bacterium RIFOXYB2_FULL_36_35]
MLFMTKNPIMRSIISNIILSFFCIFISPYESFCIAFLGQKIIHLLQLIHISLFISGSSKPFCFIALTGQMLMHGHTWF